MLKITSKEHIILEIQRAASENGGIAPGQKRFENLTGISTASWRGKYWRNYGDAVREAGLTANPPNEAHDLAFLILSLVKLTEKIGRFPTYADTRLAREADKSFPAHQSLNRLGTHSERIELVRHYATSHLEYASLLNILPPPQELDSDVGADNVSPKDGYVYMGLMKVGAEKRYKIGFTNLVDRRNAQLSIQLPERLELVHVITTDDARGIEEYWHKRFAAKNTQGEWFALTLADVRAFKKRRFM